MKLTPLLIFVFIGLVVGDGAWKLNQEYKYKLEAKSFHESSQSKDNWLGVISRARLSIRPQTDDLLIGQISQAEYIEQEATDLDLNDRYLEYTQWPLNKPFKIHLRNGAIHSMSVDRTLTNRQINQLRLIVSQLQVDTNAENVMEDEQNVLPQEDSNNGFYKTMESTVSGNCETMYDISPLPDYLTQSYRDMASTNSNGEVEFMLIVKTRNFNYCKERTAYFYNTTERSESQRYDDLSEVSRIIVSGSLKSYTIHSSITTSKVNRSPSFSNYVNVTLEAVESNNYNYNNNYQPLGSDLRNTLNIVSLVYADDSGVDSQENNRPEVRRYGRPMSVQSRLYGDPEDTWSSCSWSWFHSGETICLEGFGPEWESLKRTTCGFAGFGMKALCRYAFPGCEATACYSVVIPRSQLCDKSFGDRLPVTKGGWENCVPGFYRSRCCPN